MCEKETFFWNKGSERRSISGIDILLKYLYYIILLYIILFNIILYHITLYNKYIYNNINIYNC